MSERCSARKSNGEPCKAFPIHGTTVCRVHGGMAPQVRRKAAERVAEAKARQEAAKYVANAGELTDPLGELLRVAGEMVAWKDWLGERVGQLQADEYRFKSSQGLEQLRSEISLYTQAMAQVAKVIEAMAKLDLEAKRVRLSERDQYFAVQIVERTLRHFGISFATPGIYGFLADTATAVADEMERGGYTGRSAPAALPRAR